MASPVIESLFTDSSGNSGTFTTAGTNRVAVFVILSANNGPLTQTYKITASGLTFTRVFHDRFDNGAGAGQISIDIFTAPVAAQVTGQAWTATAVGDTGGYVFNWTYAFAVAGLFDINNPFDSNALSVAVAEHLSGGASAPTVNISTTQSDDTLINLALNSGAFTTPTVTSGWTFSPITYTPYTYGSGASEASFMIQNKAVSSPQSAAAVMGSYSDTLWYTLVLAFTGDTGGVATPGNKGPALQPILLAGTNGTQNFTGGVTSTTVGYTTDDVDEIVVLAVNYCPTTGGPLSITTVTDTNGLTWHKRSSYSIPTTVDGYGGDSVQNTGDVWWAHSPTAQSGTITINFSGAVDAGGAGTQAYQYVLSLTAPWDPNPSLPAVMYNTTPPGGGGTTTTTTPSLDVETDGPGVILGFLMSPCNLSVTAGTEFTQVLSVDNNGGNNYSRMHVESTLSDRAWTSPGFTVNQASALNGYIFIADALMGAGGVVPSIWHSIEATDVFAATGHQTVVGVLATTEAHDVFSAYGHQPLSGVLAATEAPDIFNAIGIGQGENGIFVTTEAPDTFSAYGLVPVFGTLSVTEAADSFHALGAGVIQVRHRRIFTVT